MDCPFCLFYVSSIYVSLFLIFFSPGTCPYSSCPSFVLVPSFSAFPRFIPFFKRGFDFPWPFLDGSGLCLAPKFRAFCFWIVSGPVAFFSFLIPHDVPFFFRFLATSFFLSPPLGGARLVGFSFYFEGL